MAAVLLDEARRAGVHVYIEIGEVRLRAVARPAPELLARLRAHKAELLALLRGDTCRRCGEPIQWPEPCGVIYGDGTAEHHACRRWACPRGRGRDLG
jgi:hypothetical protein